MLAYCSLAPCNYQQIDSGDVQLGQEVAELCEGVDDGHGESCVVVKL